MVGAMKTTRRSSENVCLRENWSLKSICFPQFQSKLIEKKNFLSFLTHIYLSRHRLLVSILISHAFIYLFKLFFFKLEKKDLSAKIIVLTLLILSILVNLFSLIIINRLRNRFLSNLISLICLLPMSILSCFYPFEYHIYVLIILIYTLLNLSLILSILITILITILILIIYSLIEELNQQEFE